MILKKWPKYPLMSLSPEHRIKVNVNYVSKVIKVNSGILNINKFSNYEKLIRCTGYLFKFFCKVKDRNTKKKAIEYWIKIAQREYYYEEIEFLKQEVKLDKKVPALVLNLNLFLDENEILRSNY